MKSVLILADSYSSKSLRTEMLKESRVAASRLGLSVRYAEISTRDDIDRVFAQLPSGTRAAVLVPGIAMYENRVRIAEVATKRGISVLGWQQELAKSGALMSYGANHFELGRLAADYVEKILRGVKPADLPVQEPTKFELVII